MCLGMQRARAPSQLAKELDECGVDVIFAIGPPQALAAAKATDRIPTVFVGGGVPVQIGLIKSFAYPGVAQVIVIQKDAGPRHLSVMSAVAGRSGPLCARRMKLSKRLANAIAISKSKRGYYNYLWLHVRDDVPICGRSACPVR